MAVSVTLTVNGETRTVVSDPGRSLLDIIREDFGLTGTKYGCGEGACGSCSVLLDGKRALSCTLFAADVDGAVVTTIEGLARDDGLHPVQQAFLDEGAMQCGYCTPGMIITATALLNEEPNPTDGRIAEAMDGNICRCCGYPRILAAVKRAAQLLAGEVNR